MRRAADSSSACARDGEDPWRVGPSTISEPTPSPAGAGAFRASYLLDRDSNATDVQPEDLHSVEMLMASELGIPGLVLFATFVGAALIAALRARRLPSAAALAAGARALGPFGCCTPRSTGSGATPAITFASRLRARGG